MIGLVLLNLPTTLVMAIILNNPRLKGASIYRVIFFLPVVTTTAIVGIVMTYIFGPFNGVVNIVLMKMGLIAKPVHWLGQVATALPTIIVVATWKGFGTNMLYWLAGLQAIPLELYEAAKVDGANPAQTFFRITIPLAAPGRAGDSALYHRGRAARVRSDQGDDQWRPLFRDRDGLSLYLPLRLWRAVADRIRLRCGHLFRDRRHGPLADPGGADPAIGAVGQWGQDGRHAVSDRAKATPIACMGRRARTGGAQDQHADYPPGADCVRHASGYIPSCGWFRRPLRASLRCSVAVST